MHDHRHRWLAEAMRASVLVLLLVADAAVAPAHEGPALEVGFEEHPGAIVPLDARFRDEDGIAVALSEVVRVPTILAIVYYRCPNSCDLLLAGLARALANLDARPGSDFTVVTISLDERERPADARAAKAIALQSIQRPYPPAQWRFLTGEAAAIAAVADAVGFRFRRNGEEFDHPLGLIVLSPQGKVVRYLIGTDFLPVELRMSLLEAAEGRIGPTIARVLRFCFSYDPQSRTFVFNTLRVSAIVVAAMAAGFGLYLVLSGRRRRTAAGGDDAP
jgi:protein SCO1/2